MTHLGDVSLSFCAQFHLVRKEVSTSVFRHAVLLIYLAYLLIAFCDAQLEDTVEIEMTVW